MKLRYYQENAVNSIFDYFSQNAGNPVIAMPTGTGKAFVIAAFLQRVLGMWARQRVMILTHVKELVEQDYAELMKIWPNAPAGVYSAGLNCKDIMFPIIFGGVASVANVAEAFGHRDLIIIDEAHLLSPKDDSMYQNIIARLKVINPYLKVIGLTATPYRLGQGMIIDEGLFTDICYDDCGMERFNQLVTEGFISPLIPKRTNFEIDVSGVGIVNDDFKKGELQFATDKEEITYAALQETLQFASARKSCLIFSSGVEHAEHVNEMLQSFGVPSGVVHSKMPAAQRDKTIELHKNGELWALVNNNVLTTGYNHKPIDLIVMLRATVSPGLWVQMLGRGTRPMYAEGFNLESLEGRLAAIAASQKQNCLVMDFAGNTRRLGPINDPVKPRKKGKGGGEAPVRICDACGVYNHASARFCCYCGVEFQFKTKIVSFAGTDELIRSDAPVVEYFNVERIIYNSYNSAKNTTSPPMIKVEYYSGLQRFVEYVCPEHNKSYARKKYHDWWRQRHASEPPNTTAEALQLVSELRPPKRIRVWINKQYPEVLSYEY
jgi:DNA repair protein RadD